MRLARLHAWVCVGGKGEKVIAMNDALDLIQVRTRWRIEVGSAGKEGRKKAREWCAVTGTIRYK